MESKCILNYDVLSVGKEHRVYLLVKVRGAQEDGKRKPLPINLSVVIDRSGSMGGDKLKYVKQAAQDLVRRLGSKDRLSLVAYDTTVDVLIPPRSVDDKKSFEQAIDTLKSRATTNLSGGWLQGCEFVAGGVSKKSVNRVLLLSDGLANVGVQDPSALATMARQKRSEGVTTTAFGVGMDFNEDLLSRMATEGGGAFYFIDSPDQAPAFFSEELQDLHNVVGQNLSIAIETEKEVRSVQQLYDYPNQEQNGALVYRLGDIYAEEERHQVFELALGALSEGTTDLGRIVISFDAIEGEQVKRHDDAYDIKVKAVPEGELEVMLPVVEVEKLALLQKVGRAREKAVQHADRSEFDEAAGILRAIAETLESSGIEDEELEKEHDRLLEEAMDMELGKDRYDTHSRKLHAIKTSHSHRHARFDDVVDGLHMRHKRRKQAIERGGSSPGHILWRRGQKDFSGDVITMGSAPDNDIVLSDSDVDPFHCRMERRGQDWYLIDLGSRTGTFANSGILHNEFRLSADDVLSVGATVFRLKA